MTVFPASTKLFRDLQELADIVEMQAGRGLIENIKRSSRGPLGQFAESLTRCASPPESVVACWPNLMYPMPTIFQGLQLPRILGIGSKNLKA